MELEEAKQKLEEFIGIFYEFPNPTSVSIRDYEVTAIETVLQALDNSIPKEKVKAEIQKIENELEEKYSAEKISVFSGNTYMEKFKLLGKLEVLKELLEE